MKKRFRLRVLTALLCLAMLLSVGLLHITTAAAEVTDAAYDKNRATYLALQDTMNELISSYDDRAQAHGNPSLSHQVNQLILTKYAYQNGVIMAKDKRDDVSLDLTEEFALLEAKTLLAAKITWIAYAHDVIPLDAEGNPTDTEAEKLTSNLTYSWLSTYQGNIDNNITAIDTITEDYVNDLCAEMNRIVFKQKVDVLPDRYDVPETNVKTELDAAMSAIDTLADTVQASTDLSAYDEDYFLDGAAFEAIYEVAHTAVVLERHRLDAEAEYAAIYDLLGLPASDRLNAIAAFTALLDDDTATSQINQTLLTEAKALLDRALPDNGKKFVPAYRTALINAFDAASAAAGDTSVAELSCFLDGTDATASSYPFEKYAPCAVAKDAVWEESSDSILQAIIDEYVRPDGILEKCLSQEELDFEVTRATLRKEFYRTYLDYDRQIRQTTGASAKKDPLLIAIKDKYFEADEQIRGISFHQNQPVESCKAIIKQADDFMKNKLREAEAYQFINEHSAILNDDTVTVDDREALDRAVDAFAALHEDTQAKLASERKNLNDKYKALAVLDIKNGNGTTDYGTADKAKEERQAALDKLCEAVNAPDSATANPSAIRSAAKEAIDRADAILTLLEKYDEIRDAPHYEDYADEDKAALRADADNALATLTVLTPQKPFDPATDTTVKEACEAMDRHAAIAEIKLAAKDSSLANVNEAKQDAIDRIADPSTSTTDIPTIRDNAIFHIEALIKGGELREALEDLKQEIDTLPALNEEEKAALDEEADDLLALIEAVEDCKTTDQRQTLEQAVKAFREACDELHDKATEQNLVAAKKQAKDEVEKAAQKALDELNAFEFISDKTRDELIDAIRDLVDAFERDADNATDYDTLMDKRGQTLGTIAETRVEAQQAEQTACRETVAKDWERDYENPDHYSEKNYVTVEQILSESREALKQAETVEEMIAIRDEAIRRLDAVPTILDEAKEKASEQIEETYRELMKNETLYAKESVEKLTDIYEHALAEVNQLQSISDTENALKIATEKCELMRSVRRDLLYTKGHSEAAPNSYPPNYNFGAKGLWGVLSAPGNIPYDSVFTAIPFDAADKEAAYLNAVRKAMVLTANGGVADKELLEQLRASMLLLGIDMTCTGTHEGPYRITLLLPNDLRAEDVLGVAYLKDDGSVEFYNCEIEGRLITFEIPHFSSFYIVAEKPISLWLIILLMSLILLGEVIAIAVLLFRRTKRDEIPMLAAFLPISPTMLLRRIEPSGAIPVIILLGLLIVAATVVLTWLIVDEREYRRRLAAENATVVPTIPLDLDPDPTPKPTPKPKPEPMPVVTVDEADERISDTEAEAQLETKEIPLYHPIGKKAEINIDVISEHFRQGETVSLDSLKQKGLIPKNANAIKVLARGSLDKSLTVLAHDFSVSAIKMILLTGGEAILIERKQRIKKLPKLRKKQS